MTKKIKTTEGTFAGEVKDILVDSINSILKQKEYAVLAVPGGRSVVPIFELLKSDRDIPWKQVHIFIVDERLVPIDDYDSNFKLVKEAFVNELIKEDILPQENFHTFKYDSEQNDSGVGEYETELKKFGGAYDIILLSSGEDGHIGAIYPHHHSFENEKEFFITMTDSPKPPSKRMSMSRKLVKKATTAVLLFIGSAKQEAFNKFNDYSVDAIECPAKLVLDIADSYVVTDLD